MDLSYYNTEIDKILYNSIGNDYFIENDLVDIIQFVTDTIYQYDKSLKRSWLKLIVEFLIKQKYQKVYIYDSDSSFNKYYEDNDKITLNSYIDLISHKYDYPYDTYKESIYIKRFKQLEKLKAIPQYEQKSNEWFEQRKQCLTATAIATVLDEDPYKYPIELLLEKCDRGKPFIENENVHHGKKYEQIGTMYYAFRNNINVLEFGLLQHSKYTFIGASPDGICEHQTKFNNKLSKMVGRALEIKFPKKRKINTEGELDGDICPHYYYVQMQTQLFVTKLDECDFLQCQIEEYETWDDYVNDSYDNLPGLSKSTNLEKGCLIQLLPKRMMNVEDTNMCLYNSKYIYPPKLHMSIDEIKKWIAHEISHYHKNPLYIEYFIDRIIYWRFTKIACHLVKFDNSWFESKIPVLKQFWDYILFYRKHIDKLDELVKYANNVGFSKSSDIFLKIHKDYININKDSNYEPLYQLESHWRTIYNKKYKNYNK